MTGVLPTTAMRVGLALILLVAGLGAFAGRARAATAPGRHGRSDIAADPYFLEPCVLDGARSRSCISQTVAAINHARTHESMLKAKMVLPRNYASLSPAEQTFVVINLERVDRGLRPIAGMVPLLSHVATVSAVAQLDPTPATALLRLLGVHRFQVVWADAYGALAADYEWMYNDGFDGPLTTNVGCPFAHAPDCWGHRKAILTPFSGLPTLLAGTGAASAPYGARSVAAILTGGYGGRPHFTYSWRTALAHGANGHRLG